MNHHTTDVLVVGAGVAGLTCAERLSRQGFDVIVCEARDRVGGRTSSVLAGGEVVDLGGQFVGPGQDRVYAMAAELGIDVVPTHMAGVHLVETEAGRVRRFRGTVPSLGPLALLDFGQAQARFERLARRIDPESPWESAVELDTQTLATWIGRTLHTRAGRRLFTLACQVLWAADPGELSLLHALFYARAAGSLRAIMATEGGAQQDRLVGGAQELTLRLASRLGDRVRLGTVVRAITQDDDRVLVSVDSGATITAHRVVVAVPPTLAARIDHSPPLPAARDELGRRLRMGAATKCMVVYREPFWRAAGLSGHALSLRGPLAGFVDTSPPSGRRGVLAGVVAGPTSREFALVPAEERRSAVLAELTRLFGPRAAEPVGYVEQDWSAEPFSGGAYSALFPPGAWTSVGTALRAPVGRVHWAGSETATRWYGFIDGAIRSGEAVAAEIAESGAVRPHSLD
jgi:monoamine oxidase